MNIDELWGKYATWTEGIGEWIHKANFTEAIAEIISLPVEPPVMQKPAGADEKLNGIRETLFQYLDVQLIPDIMNGIRELIRDARKEGIQFTLDIMHKHGTAKTFDDRIKKELAK